MTTGLNGGVLFREEKVREGKVLELKPFWCGRLAVRNARNSRFFHDLIFKKRRGGRTDSARRANHANLLFIYFTGDELFYRTIPWKNTQKLL